MGRQAIVGKLQSELERGITSEGQLVYVLVEVRKLLEITHRKDRFPALLFHCDWALHSHMDRPGALRVLQRFDEFCGYYFGDRDTVDMNFDKELSDTLGIARFREEFEDFLSSLHIQMCATNKTGSIL